MLLLLSRVHQRAHLHPGAGGRVLGPGGAGRRLRLGHPRRGPSRLHQPVPDQHAERAGHHVQRRVGAGAAPSGGCLQTAPGPGLRLLVRAEPQAEADFSKNGGKNFLLFFKTISKSFFYAS